MERLGFLSYELQRSNPKSSDLGLLRNNYMGHIVSSRSHWWDIVLIVNMKIVGKYRAFSVIFIPMYNFCYVENPVLLKPFVDFQVYSYIGSEKKQRLY